MRVGAAIQLLWVCSTGGVQLGGETKRLAAGCSRGEAYCQRLVESAIAKACAIPNGCL